MLYVLKMKVLNIKIAFTSVIYENIRGYSDPQQNAGEKKHSRYTPLLPVMSGTLTSILATLFALVYTYHTADITHSTALCSQPGLLEI